MAKNSIRDYSATASQNTDIDSIDIDENCPASNLNNSQRALMAHLKNVSTGAVNLETPAADSLTVSGDLTVDTSTLHVDATNNRVGVGTASPAATQHTVSSGAAVSIQATTNAASGYHEYRYNTSTVAGYIGNGSGILSGANNSDFIVRSEADLVFNSNGNNERLRITSAGDAGIGTSSPNAKLDVEDTAGSLGSTKDDTAEFFRNDGTYGPRLQIRHSTTGTDIHHTYSTGASNLTFSNANTERMRLDSSGRLLINRTSASGVNPHSKLHVLADSAVSAATIQIGTNGYNGVSFLNASGSNVGSIVINASSTAYNTSSDHRLKENVADMTGAIDRVKALAPKRFNFIADDSVTVDGFLAHEAQAVVPESVTGTHNEVDSDGNAVMQGIDQSKLVPLLTGALQEAITKIETLETEMTALKARVTALEA